MFSLYFFLLSIMCILRWIDQKVNSSDSFFFACLFDSDCVCVCVGNGKFFVTLRIINLASRQHYVCMYPILPTPYLFLFSSPGNMTNIEICMSLLENVNIYTRPVLQQFYDLWSLFLCENNVSTVTYFSCNFSYFYTRHQ